MDSHEKEDLTRMQQYVKKYDADFKKLEPYIAYFEEKASQAIAHDYDGEQGQTTMAFPVYDGTLMSFVRTAQKTVFMDRNYFYAYTKRRIKTSKQEEEALAKATLKDEDFLNAVISKYVSEGMRKTGVWQDAVTRKLFLTALKKHKENLDYCKRF